MVEHSVPCCKCGKSEKLNFQYLSDLTYLPDILNELGWKQDRYGRWFCKKCSATECEEDEGEG